MKTKTITGTYGSNETGTDVYVYTDKNDMNWYVCHDSVNVNATYEELEDGVNVELVEDCDTCTAQSPICSEADLSALMEDQETTFEDALNSFENGQKVQAVEQIDECGGLYDFLNEVDAQSETLVKIAMFYAYEHSL